MAIRNTFSAGLAASLALTGLALAPHVAQAPTEPAPGAVALVAERLSLAHEGDAGFGGVWIEQTAQRRRGRDTQVLTARVRRARR
jgi:hypothetical protein